MSKLTLDDIADTRAYERERDEFRRRVIELKRRRRVTIGPFVSLVFENAETIRFQIQEMARVERIDTDAGIQAEIDVYNVLVPYPGTLAATMMLELTNDADLRRWLPDLVGIEQAVQFELADGSVVRCRVDEGHARQLTRTEITSSVHYVHFDFEAAQVDALSSGGGALAIVHPAYRHATPLTSDTVTELVTTLRNGG